MGKRRRNRITSKITQLPDYIKDNVNSMLLDTSITYTDISDWLKSEGFDISKSAVGRYAMNANEAARRVAETLERTKAIASAVDKNPEIDYTKASRMVLMDGLMQRVSTAEEEFQEMPLDKAGRLIASLSRVTVMESKARHDMKTKAELAFKELEDDILKVIKADAVLSAELHSLLERARERLTAED